MEVLGTRPRLFVKGHICVLISAWQNAKSAESCYTKGLTYVFGAFDTVEQATSLTHVAQYAI